MKVLLTALGLVLLGACSVETIVAARTKPDDVADASMPQDAATADAGPSGIRCGRNADCVGNEYCDRPSCEAREGRCRIRPSVCAADAAPVCGCDGVTYFNDCIRRQTKGEPIRVLGECTSQGRRCGGGGRPCGPGEFCARQVPPIDPPPPFPCPPNPPGACWMLPTVCGPPTGGSRFNACDGAPLTCMDACEAIRSGHPHVRANDCPGP
jgi:hypothetical protein